MAEKVPEDRPPQTDSPEQRPEQSGSELAQPEEPKTAAEQRGPALEMEGQPSPPVDTPEPLSEQLAADDAQGHFDPLQNSSPEALETSVPNAKGGEAQNDASEETPDGILDVQVNTISCTVGDAPTDVTHDFISNKTIDDATDDHHLKSAELPEFTEDTPHKETVTPVEPSAEPIEPAKPTAPLESSEPETAESSLLVQSSEQPAGQLKLAEPFEPAAPMETTAASATEAQTTTSHPQSSLGSPSFESYAFPKTEGAASVSQRTAPIQNGDSSGAQTFSVPEPAPSTASSIQPGSSVSQIASTSPTAASIEQGDAAPQTGSPIQQPVSVSPLKPVQPPSPASQSSFPSQRAASPILQSHAQKATSSGHRNGGSAPNYAPSSGSCSPMQKLASPVQKPAYPTYRAHSPTPKVHSPLARPYFSSMMSPHETMHSQMGHQNPSMYSGALSGFGGAFQSPVLSASGYLPPYTQNVYQTHPSTFPQQQQQQPAHDRRYSGYSESNYMPSFQNLRDLSMMNGHGLDGKVHDVKGHMPQPDVDGENIFLLQRLNDAIPDLSRLLHGYKSTQNKLQTRESEIQQMQTQYEQSTMRKDFYIEALQNQMRKAANDNAEEISRLKHAVNGVRLELGDLDEKHKDLEETLAETQKSNEELSQSKAELEFDVAKLSNDSKEEQEAREKATETLRQEHADALATQEQELTDAFEAVMAEEATSYREAMKALETRLLGQQQAMKNEYEEQKRQMQEAHVSLQADFDSKVAELESTQADLSELDAKHKELEETRVIYINEIEAINAAFSDKERQWEEHRTDLETQVSQKNEELANVEQERQKLEGNCNDKESQLQHAREEMWTTMDNMDKEHERLKKTLSSLGEATDLKSSKGDEFFLESFEELRHSIVSLSKEHFAYLPIEPSKGILAKVPSELPSFLDNTPASRELRSAYIQHVISTMLNYRIFQPFLFTLGRRYDNADIFFQMLSMDIRRKSVRREAFWRQQTLKAAYTAPDAKHSINMTAAVIVDEIIDHIKHFADPTQLDPLVMGVRKIVKLAAETWRHARVERELIAATLPAPDAEGPFNQDWEEYGTGKKGGGGGQVLLRTFPQITREVAHEDLVGDEEKEDRCTYSTGSVLYSDSPVVKARRQELFARKRKSV